MSQRLKKYVRITVVIGNIMAEACRNCFVVLLNLLSNLWVIIGCGYLLSAQLFKELAGELFAIVYCHYICWYLLWNNPIAKKCVCHICNRNLSC